VSVERALEAQKFQQTRFFSIAERPGMLSLLVVRRALPISAAVSPRELRGICAEAPAFPDRIPLIESLID